MADSPTIPLPGSSGPSDADHTARDFVRAAWRELNRSPELVAWRVVGGGARLALRPLALFWLTGLIGAGLGIGIRSNGSLPAAIAELDVGVLVGGLAGFVAVLWIAGIVIDAIVDGGVLESLAAGFRGDDESRRTVFGYVGTGFLRVVGLRLVGAIIQATLVVTAATTVLAVSHVFGMLVSADAGGIVVRSLLLTIPAFLYLTLALLVRGTLRVAAAPLFVDETSVGDALIEGAGFFLDKFAAVYRIVIDVARLLLVPLLGYLGFAIVAGIWGFDGPLGPLLEVVRLTGQFALLVSIAVAAILFDGALMAYYAHATGTADIPTDGPTDETADEPVEAAKSPYDESTRLDELLPESRDHVVRLADRSDLDVDAEDSGSSPPSDDADDD